MLLYSYKGQEPALLPGRILISKDESESGLKESRTSLHELTQEELSSLGFFAVELPEYDQNEFNCVWDGNQYNIIPISEEEKNARNLIEEEVSEPDWADLETRFSNLEVFKKLFTSKVPFLMQMASDMRTLVTKAKYNEPQAFSIGVFNIFQTIEILSIIDVAGITQEDRDRFLNTCYAANLDKVPAIPSEEWISKHYFELSEEHLQYHDSAWGHYTHCIKSTGEDVFS